MELEDGFFCALGGGDLSKAFAFFGTCILK
jgi:hypothetical protein